MKTDKNIVELLGEKASFYLEHICEKITKDELQTPSKNSIDKVFGNSNRNPQVLRSLSQLYNHGNLAGTGYLSILPVDQGIEHSAAYSFYKNPDYFDPENIIKLALEAGCNGVASTFGVLGLNARKYAHKIPFIVKINHNELLTYPNKYDQTLFGKVKTAWDMGAIAVGATIYFGSAESNRQLKEIAEAFEEAHNLGMATILWCYTRNEAFKTEKEDYHAAADVTGQANHLGVTIQADIIKQKLPTNNFGFKEIGFGKYDDEMYKTLTTDHPIDLCRLQVANCYMGKIGLINSGGGSKGESDLVEAITTAVINKRAGGSGLIMGRKAFQKPFTEGIELLRFVQDVYLDQKISIA
ncbi:MULTISPECIES: class I fructose-bisphosphate aldolase [Cyclobacteriaceae]|jgi:fructose-bisphosphate aldolase, class I|uniref:fructose-bisphosphate aldolase n=2 Tax=Cytophagales TaxID=768507 RepID=L0G318_ECHVK|nr:MULTISPECIES: class I fructose-bisphosphate aldolase [Cyclobacteriaceae]AGA79391.1 DhnA-type fructose-1,6-bisphosphate aldolase-like enzyme [Echinicola vietnamensis DSM 17526]MBD3630440.1 class I fructose-bisphosphate aldolase [Cyclobacterium sp.]PTB96140.1 class I fructose-bisphosphate aldolase [Marivirga lumbricoides]